VRCIFWSVIQTCCLVGNLLICQYAIITYFEKDLVLAMMQLAKLKQKCVYDIRHYVVHCEFKHKGACEHGLGCLRTSLEFFCYLGSLESSQILGNDIFENLQPPKLLSPPPWRTNCSYNMTHPMYNWTTQVTNPTMSGMFEKENSTTHGVKPNSNIRVLASQLSVSAVSSTGFSWQSFPMW
jgi:hypothetical protein